MHGAADAQDSWNAVRQDIFWLVTIPVLVLCYTTFESFYRSGDVKFLSLLPVDGRAYLNAVLGRAYLLHLGLFLPGLFYSLHLASRDATSLGLYCGVWTLLTFGMAIPVAMGIHIAAGNSTVGGSSRLKSYLSSGTIANEAAFLLYSPVAALAAIMAIGIFSDLFLFESIVTGRAQFTWGPIAWSTLAAAYAWRTAARVVSENFFPILAKFSEAETPLSYGDDGRPSKDDRLLFSGLARGPARTYFLRDDKQLRRRYRLDKILLLLFPLVLLRLNAGLTASADVLWTCMAPVLGFVSLLLVTSFRTQGPELQSHWLRHALPHKRASEWVGGFWADAAYPFWAWLTGASFCFIYGSGREALFASALGLALTVVVVALARFFAQLSGAGRTGLAALIWRLACLSAIGVFVWQR